MPIVHRENEAAAADDKPVPETATPVPQRYIAYLFDDVHLTNADLPTARSAAAYQFESLRPTDRTAIFTTSGQVHLDFTDDRTQLLATLKQRSHALSEYFVLPGGPAPKIEASPLKSRVVLNGGAGGTFTYRPPAPPLITTEGDEVQIAGLLVSLQAPRHAPSLRVVSRAVP